MESTARDAQNEPEVAREVPRVPPDEVYDRITSKEALLVCAYKSDFMYKAFELTGSMPLKDFEAQLQSLQRDQEIFFY